LDIKNLKKMASEIISFDDLRELSGFRNLRCIKRWLGDQGVPYLTDRYGRPRVNRYALRRVMGGDSAGMDTALQGNQEPDWDKMK